MIGQKKLQKKLNNLTLDSMPHSLILMGENGCGKHLLCNEIGKKLNLPIKDISADLTLDTIDNIYLSVEPTIYLIDLDRMITEGKRIVRGENVILKILEEPLAHSFLIVLCQRKSQLLDTIINRCQIWEFEPYIQDELSQFAKGQLNQLIYKVASTPGKLLKYQECSFDDMYALCEKIITKGYIANLPNLLSITNKIGFENYYVAGKKYSKDSMVIYNSKKYKCLKATTSFPTDKSSWEFQNNVYDFNCVVDLLVEMIYNIIITTNDNSLYELYSLTSKLSNDRYISSINKKTLFENYLCNIKLIKH